LKWASALAADVYDWAKKTEAEFKAWVKDLVPVEVIDNGTGKFVTDVTVTNDANGHHITITRADVEWNDIQNKPDLALKSDIPTNHKIRQTPVTDPTASGKALEFIDTIAQNENGEITATKKSVNLDDYAKRTDLPTELGVMSVTGAGAIDAKGNKDVEVSLKLDNSGNVELTQGANGLKAEYDLVGGLKGFGIKRTEADENGSPITYEFGRDGESVNVVAADLTANVQVETTNVIAHGTISGALDRGTVVLKGEDNRYEAVASVPEVEAAVAAE
jgi:hypothetical protein